MQQPFRSPLELALEMRRRGWWPTPVRGKIPFLEDWPNLRGDPVDRADDYARGCTGVGVILGASGLNDLEADCTAAEAALQELAPDTGCIWHRSGRQHRLYECAEGSGVKWEIPARTEQPGRKQVTLVELRGGNEQSVYPGSRHPSGAEYCWVKDGSPTAVPRGVLLRAARLAAVAGALAEYWPSEGGRHAAALASSGYLRRAGLTEQETTAIIRAAASTAGDEELADRMEAVRSTYAKGEEQPCTGLPRLEDVAGTTLAAWLRRHLPVSRWKAGSAGVEEVTQAAEPQGGDPGLKEQRVEGASRQELLVAATAATGQERTAYLRQLAAALAGDPLEAERYAEEVRAAGLVSKGTFLAEVRSHLQRMRPTAPVARRTDDVEDLERVGIYAIHNGQMTYDRDTQSGPVRVPMCNFTARITCEEVRDDGADRTQVFTIAGRLQNGETLPSAVVPSERYSSMTWVTAEWGTRAVVFAGQAVRDHLRVAVQVLSGDVPRRTVFGHLGWRRVAGAYLYLHALGAIGPNGPAADVEVSLGDGKLGGYALPDPPDAEELKRCVRASLSVLSLAPRDITYLLLAAVYRAPLGEVVPIDLAVFLAGGTGVQKSELSAIAQAHYGEVFHGKALPGNWSTTANTLEKQAFLVKDAVFAVDDFAPCGTTADVQRLHREADRLFRAQGNRSGRGRMRADGSLRAEYYPRGLVLSSGEDVPQGQSVRARMLVVEVSKGDVNLEELTRCQGEASSGVYARALAGYLAWLAPQMETLGPALQHRRQELRTEARKAGAYHDRVPDNLASIAVGLEMVLQYAQAVEAISADEAAGHWTEGWTALQRIAQAQSRHQSTEDPAQRFLALLSGVLISGQGHLADASDNSEPKDADHWGWREFEMGTGENYRREWRAQGVRIGWVDGEDVLLHPEITLGAVQRLAREQGTSVPITQQTLWKRLDERGLLASREPSQGRFSVRRMIAGKRERVLHLRKQDLSPDSGPSGPAGPKGANPAVDGTGSADHLLARDDTRSRDERAKGGASAQAEAAVGPLGPDGPLFNETPVPPTPAVPRTQREVIEL